MQIVGALRSFKRADPRFVLVGSYPQGVNRAIVTGSYFSINLMANPFNLWPSEIYCENTGDPRAIKHILVYTRQDVGGWDLDAVEDRVRAKNWQ